MSLSPQFMCMKSLTLIYALFAIYMQWSPLMSTLPNYVSPSCLYSCHTSVVKTNPHINHLLASLFITKFSDSQPDPLSTKPRRTLSVSLPDRIPVDEKQDMAMQYFFWISVSWLRFSHHNIEWLSDIQECSLCHWMAWSMESFSQKFQFTYHS